MKNEYIKTFKIVSKNIDLIVNIKNYELKENMYKENKLIFLELRNIINEIYLTYWKEKLKKN